MSAQEVICFIVVGFFVFSLLFFFFFGLLLSSFISSVVFKLYLAHCFFFFRWVLTHPKQWYLACWQVCKCGIIVFYIAKKKKEEEEKPVSQSVSQCPLCKERLALTAVWGRGGGWELPPSSVEPPTPPRVPLWTPLHGSHDSRQLNETHLHLHILMNTERKKVIAALLRPALGWHRWVICKLLFVFLSNWKIN